MVKVKGTRKFTPPPKRSSHPWETIGIFSILWTRLSEVLQK